MKICKTIYFIILLCSSIYASNNENIQNAKNIVNANPKIFKQNNIDVITKNVKQKDKKISNSAKKLLEKFMKKSDIDISKYDKVTLKDAVYEAVSNSDNIKAQKQKVIQAQLNYDDAMANFYPIIDAKYENKKTRIIHLEKMILNINDIQMRVINLLLDKIYLQVDKQLGI
jgi:glutamyl/glutaminyl-tRNA synthetase